MKRGAALGLLFLAACQSPASPPGAPERSAAQPGAPRPSASGAAPKATSERTFGAPFAIVGEPTDVAQVLRAPEAFLRQTIKCSGTVARVCQAAGCWLELRDQAGGEGLRVPMAGHAFFVPQDIVGKPAIVEGKLAARDLPEAELSHLRGEGLKAVGPLFLEATSVAVR